MAYLIVQRFADGRQGRMYQVNPNTGEITYNATITAHATKFASYAQALAALETLPEWMTDYDDAHGITAKIEPCRDPIHGLK